MAARYRNSFVALSQNGGAVAHGVARRRLSNGVMRGARDTAQAHG